MYQLEERILFDGAAAADIAAAQQEQQAQDASQQNQTQPQAEASQTSDQAQPSQDPSPILNPDSAPAVQDTQIAADATPVAAAIDPSATATPQPQVNVLVVSESLENADQLFKSANSETVVVKYDPRNTSSAELLQQINDALNGEKADSIGFVTDKAKDGKISLFADSETSAESLSTDAQQSFWNGIEGLLSEKGQVNIFSSDLASSENGKHLIDSIAQIMDHQVAASDDVTGDPDAGGDWELEYVAKGTGSVDLIDEYFSRESIQSFDHRIENPTEVAFINPTVQDVDTILEGIGDQAEVVYLSKENAFDDITAYLQGRTDIDAIHLITHGNEGQFKIGYDIVNSDYISSHAEALAAWGKSLSADADILIYGCKLASNDVGKSIVNDISAITGADVAASTDRTGLYGNWDLEYQTGIISTNGFVISDYSYSLAQWTVNAWGDTGNNNPGGYDVNCLTLRDAVINSVDGDTIVFAPYASIFPTVAAPYPLPTLDLQDTLTITSNISIDGTILMPTGVDAYLTIDASNSAVGRNYRAITIDVVSTSTTDPVTGNVTTTNVTLSNMTIQGGFASSAVPPTPSPIGIGNGGGIFISSLARVTLDSVDITGNQADLDGGGIYNDGILTINSYNLLDGALGIQGNTTNNGSGAGIYNTNTLTIEAGLIDTNTANASGGGIYSCTGNITISTTTINGNTATGGSGGGIYIMGNAVQTSPIYFYDDTFTGNTAGVDGGGLFFTNGSIDSGNVLEIEHTSFNTNTATRNGGGINIINAAGNIVINTLISSETAQTLQSTISNNEATNGSGGGIYIADCSSDSVNIGFIKMDGNHTQGSNPAAVEQNGGAIYISNVTNLTLTDMEIINSQANQGNGAGIYYTTDSTGILTVKQSNISNNVATAEAIGLVGYGGNGGAIYMANGGTLNIDNSTLAYNDVVRASGTGGSGGGIFMEWGIINITFGTLAYNMCDAAGFGAHIYIEGSILGGQTSDLTVQNSIIFNSDVAAVVNPFTTQIRLPVVAQRGTIDFSVSNNAYSHYNVDLATDADHSLDLGDVTSYELIGDTAVKTALLTNAAANGNFDDYFATTLYYYANYRTRALAVTSDDSWLYPYQANPLNSIGTNISGITYDQRGNTRGGQAFVFDATTNTWVKVSNATPTIGAFEPLFHLEVTSKGDDSALTDTSDPATKSFSLAQSGGEGLTLREAIYWIDSRAPIYNALVTVQSDEYYQRYIGFDSTKFTFNASATTATNLITLTNGVLDTQIRWGNSGAGEIHDLAISLLAWDFTAGATYGDMVRAAGAIKFSDNAYRSLDDLSRITVTTSGSSIFEISAGDRININNLTLTGGSALNGGAITNNSAAAGWGLILGNTVVSNNTADYFGGGIYNTGDMFLFGCSVTGNSATNANSLSAGGGGIYNAAGANLYIDSTRLTNNTAQAGGSLISVSGGAVYNDGTLTIERSQITGNTVFLSSADTVVSDNAGDATGRSAVMGGGLYNSVTGTLYLGNSTVSENTLDMTNVSVVQSTWRVAQPAAPAGPGGTRDYNISLDYYWANGGSAIYNDGGANSLYSYFNTIINNMSYVGAAAFTSPVAGVPVGTTPGGALVLPERLAAIYRNNAAANSLHLSSSIVSENLAIYVISASQNHPAQRSDIYVSAAASVANAGVDAHDNVIGSFNDNIPAGITFPTVGVAPGQATVVKIDDGAGNITTAAFDWSAAALNNVGGLYNRDSLQQYAPGDLTTGYRYYGDFAAASTDGSSADLRLQFTLNYNGALTQTYRVLTGSIAATDATIIVNPNFNHLDTDQRGAARPAGANATNIGSYEGIGTITIGSGAMTGTVRTGYDYTDYQPLWNSTDLTLQEVLLLADDGSTINLKTDWQKNGTLRNGVVVANELNSSGQLIFNLPSQLTINRSITFDGVYEWNDVDSTGAITYHHLGYNLQLAAATGQRFFYVKSSVPNTLSVVTLMNMTMGSSKITGDGGAIYSNADLYLDNVTINSCQASNNGGAIYSSGGFLELRNGTTISNNKAIFGGGIYVGTNYSDGHQLGATVLGNANIMLHITQSSVIGNTATNATSTGCGGGIYMMSGNAYIEFSTVGNNKAAADGGGIYAAQTVELQTYNSTIANNTAARNGGGIMFSGIPTKRLVIDFSTIANNQCRWTVGGTAASGTYQKGGGIYAVAADFTLTNSILAQNFNGTFNTSSGTHADLYCTNLNIAAAANVDNSIIGAYTIIDLNGQTTLSPLNVVPNAGANNYFISNSQKWINFHIGNGTAAAPTPWIDTSLKSNGGKTKTVYLNFSITDAIPVAIFNRTAAAAVADYDQTRLNDNSVVRETAGAFEKPLAVNPRTLTFTGGTIGSGADGGSTWINAAGTTLYESIDGPLTAADTTFIFDDTQTNTLLINIPGASYAVGTFTVAVDGLLLSTSIANGTYVQIGANIYKVESTTNDDTTGLVNSLTFTTPLLAIANDNAVVTPLGTALSTTWTLNPDSTRDPNSQISIVNGAYFSAEWGSNLTGNVLLQNNATLELSTYVIDNINLKVDHTAVSDTTVIYNSTILASAYPTIRPDWFYQDILTQETVTNAAVSTTIEYDNLVMTGNLAAAGVSAPLNTKTATGPLNVHGDFTLGTITGGQDGTEHDNVLLKVVNGTGVLGNLTLNPDNAGAHNFLNYGQINVANNLAINSVAGSSISMAGGGTMTIAGNVTIDGATTLANTTITAGSGKTITFGSVVAGTAVTLNGGVTIGSTSNAVSFQGNTAFTVNGVNSINSSRLDIALWNAGNTINTTAGSTLNMNISSQALVIVNGAGTSTATVLSLGEDRLDIDATSRFAITTTNTITATAGAAATVDGTLALNGRNVFDPALYTLTLNNNATLEFNGSLQFKKNAGDTNSTMNMPNNISILGTVTVDSTVTGRVIITSTGGGDITIASSIAKSLELNAANDIFFTKTITIGGDLLFGTLGGNDIDGTGGGNVTATGNIAFGAGVNPTFDTITITAGSGKTFLLNGNNMTLDGNATVGSTGSTVRFSNAVTVTVNGANNNIITKGLDITTAAAWGAGTIHVTAGATLTMNISTQGLALVNAGGGSTATLLTLNTNRLDIDATGRLEIVTTSSTNITATCGGVANGDGILSLNGKNVIDPTFTIDMNAGGSLELKGTIVFKKDAGLAVTSTLNKTAGLDLIGTITVDSLVTGAVSITSTGGEVIVGSNINSGAKYTGNGKNLTISAATDVSVGNITNVANFSSTDGGGAGDLTKLLNSITATGNVVFTSANPVEVQKAYTSAALTTVSPISISAGTGAAGVITFTNGLSSLAAGSSELQLTAYNLAANSSNIGAVTMNNSLTLNRGGFASGNITLSVNGSNLTVKAALNVTGNIDIQGNGKLENSAALTVTGDIQLAGGSSNSLINNLSTGTITTNTISLLDTTFAGTINNPGAYNVAGAINYALGYGIGTTTINVDGFNGPIAVGSYITIAGDVDLSGNLIPHKVLSTVGGTTPITITFSTPLGVAILDNTVVTRVLNTGSRTISVSGFTGPISVGSFVLIGADAYPHRVLSVSGGATPTSITLSEGVTVPVDIGAAITVHCPAGITNAGSITAAGAVTTIAGNISNSKIFNALSITDNFAGATLVNTNFGNITNTGTGVGNGMTITAGITLTSVGSINNTGNLSVATITLPDGRLTNSGTLTNTGLITMTEDVGALYPSTTSILTNTGTLAGAGGITLNGSAFNNNSGGSITGAKAIILNDNGAAVASFTNAGTINNVATTITMNGDGALTNTGTINLNTITINNATAAATGTRLNNNSGTLTANGVTVALGSINNKATFKADALTLTNGNLTNSSSLAEKTAGAGTILIDGPGKTFTNTGTVTYQNVTLDGKGILLTSSNTLTINGNLTIRNAGAGASDYITIKVTGGTARVGTVDLQCNAQLAQGKLTTTNFVFTLASYFRLMNTTAGTNLEITGDGALTTSDGTHFFVTEGTSKVWVLDSAGTTSIWMTDTYDIAAAGAHPVDQIDIQTGTKMVGLGTFSPLTLNGKYNGTPSTVDNSYAINRVWTIARTSGDVSNLTVSLYWSAAEEPADYSDPSYAATNGVYKSTGSAWSTTPVNTGGWGGGVTHRYDLPAMNLGTGSYSVSAGPILAMNDSSFESDYDELERAFIDAIMNGKEQVVEQQMIAEVEDKAAADSMFVQMANRGSVLERNKLFKSEVDLGLDALLAV